jgi:hypothetical protein
MSPFGILVIVGYGAITVEKSVATIAIFFAMFSPLPVASRWQNTRLTRVCGYLRSRSQHA